MEIRTGLPNKLHKTLFNIVYRPTSVLISSHGIPNALMIILHHQPDVDEMQ